jgi:cytochrome c-type biogenesis protein CcmH/NrfG
MTVHELPDDDERVQRLRRAAEALPREVPPAQDPWPGIKARIDAARVVPMTGAPHQGTPGVARRWRLIAAAAVLVVASSAVTSAFLGTRNQVPQAVNGGAEPAATAHFASDRGKLVSEVFRHYDAAASDLEHVLQARRDRLSPATQRVLEESLRVIDQAIGEARAALEKDPTSQDGLDLLGSVYRQKLDLLRRANALPLRSS